MRNAATRTAETNGYTFSGVWARSWEREKIAKRREEFKAEGYRVRTIRDSDGMALYIKDTEKTLKAKADKAAAAEDKRIEKAQELRTWLNSLDLNALKSHTLWQIQHEVKQALARD